MRLVSDKIKPAQRLKKICVDLKKQGKTIGFTNGCFDILHCGHISYLQAAKKNSDILIVGVNSDESVKRIKGSARPILELKNRLETVAALECVDFALHFEEGTPLKIIKLLKPHRLFKGADWHKDKVVGKKYVESYGGRLIRLPVIKGQSSSKIIKKIEKLFPGVNLSDS